MPQIDTGALYAGAGINEPCYMRVGKSTPILFLL